MCFHTQRVFPNLTISTKKKRLASLCFLPHPTLPLPITEDIAEMGLDPRALLQGAGPLWKLLEIWQIPLQHNKSPSE